MLGLDGRTRGLADPLAENLEKKVNRAVKEGALRSLTLLEQIDEAEHADILSAQEAQQLREAEQARQQIIAVDDFCDEELRRQPLDNLFNKSKGKKATNQDDLTTEVV